MNVEQLKSVFSFGELQDWILTVDFLRLTRPKSMPRKYFVAPLQQAVEHELQHGFKRLPYRIHTMRGFQVGHAAGGESATHLMVELRGYLAEMYYDNLLFVESRCTRLDFALTAWFQDDPGAYPGLAYWKASEHLLRQRLEKSRKMPVMWKSHTGDTCYLGSRSSQRFCRIYDKGRQSDDEAYRQSVRVEVEIKSDLAQVIWQNIQNGEPVETIGLGEIEYILSQHGLTLGKLAGDCKRTKVPAPTTAPDIVGKLAWLQRQVAPALRDLQKRGFYEQALACLGLETVETVTDVTDE